MLPIGGWFPFSNTLSSIVSGLVVLFLGWLGKRFVWPRLIRFLAQRRARRAAKDLELPLAYLTHVRDGVMPAVWRTSATPDEVRGQIRQGILEPIRAYLAHAPGEHIKVVWFRPDDARTYLSMYEQIGHTPEGQAAMRLPIGTGLAGTAFSSGETIYCPDCSADNRFKQVPSGHQTGSIACVPIKRSGEVTGVLSVWSTCKDAFRLAETLYFEALAAAIAGLEVFEQQQERDN